MKKIQNLLHSSVESPTFAVLTKSDESQSARARLSLDIFGGHFLCPDISGLYDRHSENSALGNETASDFVSNGTAAVFLPALLTKSDAMNALTLAATRRRSSIGSNVRILDGLRRPDLLSLPTFSLSRALRCALGAVRPALTAENLNLAAGVGAFAGMLLALGAGSAAGVYTCAAVGFSTIFIGMPLTEGSTTKKGGTR